jgi:hypothetical protein
LLLWAATQSPLRAKVAGFWQVRIRDRIGPGGGVSPS